MPVSSKRRPLYALVAALWMGLVTACAPTIPHVVKGEALSTGNTTFDDFFVAVKQVRSEALAAADDEGATHKSLSVALGLETKAKRALTLDESSLRAKKLIDRGVHLHLAITPGARMLVARAPKSDLGPDSEALLKTMEEAAKSSLELRKRFADVATRAAELEKRRIALRAEAPAAFRDGPQARRDEIIAELDAAHGVLAEALHKADGSAGAASRFVIELAQAVETGAVEALAGAKGGKGKRAAPVFVAPPQPPVAAAPPAAAPPAAAPPAAAAKPAAAPARPASGPAAGPAPAAKKKPKGGGDDFEP